MAPICIVCKKPLSEIDPGKITGLVVGHASDIPIGEYIPPEPSAYHDRCEFKARKILEEEDIKRWRAMGVID